MPGGSAKAKRSLAMAALEEMIGSSYQHYPAKSFDHLE
jgi:hypothetical protein